ncbi:hypothetical protein CQ010_01440 [Arthrobacter sp. MYb211]|uniref:hypothetical protein n=1 Tax=unclassified Arthrobacter TaxID=235627 RepID=UPI000CFD7B30|nr:MULTISPECIES: hypothetical protein [unclassified Arthrobacter]PRA13338.1 hypothetical protein CQ015_03695 [Arthrobacter sp. MYb221]PRC10535.1 hypothetical protein CQ010_01440 [Arthrobacter sp. MYb211]
MNVSPCKYPRCRDSEGNPELTHEQFCDACQRRFQRLLDDVIQDYVYLKTKLPRPVATTTAGRGAAKAGYGHPREWASSLAQEIIKTGVLYALTWLRETRGDKQSRIIGDESTQAQLLSKFWVAGFEHLLRWDQAPDMAEALGMLHNQARMGLGHTSMVRTLIAPCPKCQLRALAQAVGSDTIECRMCYHRMPVSDYGRATDASLAAQQRYNYNQIDYLLAAYDATAEKQEQATDQ